MSSFRYFVLNELRECFPLGFSARLFLIRFRAVALIQMEAFYQQHERYQWRKKAYDAVPKKVFSTAVDKKGE
jgi:hypothetical protein